MVSKSSLSDSKFSREQGSDDMGDLTYRLVQLKRQIQSERLGLIREKLEKNSKKVQAYVSDFQTLAASRDDVTVIRSDDSGNFLSLRMKNPLYKVAALRNEYTDGDNSNMNGEEIVYPLTAKLPVVEKMLPYTTWIFLDRNQRMTDDQSVVGRRRIYYDPHGSEALICSDSEEELGETEGAKYEFSEGEDRLIRVAFQEGEIGVEVLDTLSKFIGATTLEIRERCTILMEKDQSREEKPEDILFLDKSLSSALDSFDNLFCRRCLVFDCLLHGCSQNLIYPNEKLPYTFDPEEERKPCGDQCIHLRMTSDVIGDNGKEVSELPLNQASEWRQFEADLYLKGIQIFGRNSCLISRNLLSGLKTCKQVSNYMYGEGVSMIRSSSFKDDGKADMDYVDPMKLRICRKRGRARKVKSSWKSSGHPSLWRRDADGKDQTCKQYVPCGCQPVCGKECPCIKNGNCCEKYCGCSKGCKNRFRGCHCAKSHCKSRQCPCFAAGRECDPDVCKNCWVSCGDSSLGEPLRQGDSQCGNMRLLLRNHQRILFAKSDVAGWGAFLQKSVNKNDYLGEYTGELISHQEADKRGKIYDRANSSYLFDLNDQFVLDACRKGNKLKFANHSSSPNCYAKVMLVAGDHRVGIFANERIESGEEIFYDYRYGPDQAPAWARKPEGGSSKREHSPTPQGRAKKHQSG